MIEPKKTWIEQIEDEFLMGLEMGTVIMDQGRMRYMHRVVQPLTQAERDAIWNMDTYVLTSAEVVERFGNQQTEHMDKMQPGETSPLEMIRRMKQQLQESGIDVHEHFSDKENRNIQDLKTQELIRNAKDISDGYHTFGQLYETRAVLNIALFKVVQKRAETEWFLINTTFEGFRSPTWRSKLHSDGTMFDGMFILGLGTRPGEQITFHYHLDKWDDCDFAKTLDNAPEFDGHTPEQALERIKHL